jgi:hypothetical protein
MNEFDHEQLDVSVAAIDFVRISLTSCRERRRRSR